MLKKHLISLALMVMAIVVSNAGTWKIHNYYVTSQIQNVFDIGDKVYYLNSNVLFQYDKPTNIITALSSENILSDDNITQVYFDSANRLLFVTYINSNIDVIDESGVVTNISNVKDAAIHVYNYSLNSAGELAGYTDKKITDITFVNGIAYVSTGYGYISIDESSLSVINDNVFGQTNQINSVTVLGDVMVILTNDACYYGPVGATNPLQSYSKYTGVSVTNGKLFPIDEHSVFVLGSAGLYNFDFTSGSPSVNTLVSAMPTCVQKTTSGYIANFAGMSYYYTIDSTGKTATKASSTLGFASSDPSGDGSIWINDANGLHLNNSTTYYKSNSITTNKPYWLKYNTAMNLLYVGVSARNGHTEVYGDLPANVINTYDGSVWANATAYTANGAGYEFVINPFDSTTYFRASWESGIHKVTNNVLSFTYTKNNSLIGTYKAQPTFDKYGNMWVVSSYGNPSCPVAVLPMNKVANNSVSKSDWFQPSGLLGLNTGTMQRSRFVISKLNNVKIYTDGDYLGTGDAGRIWVWDNFNEDPKVDSYKLSSITHFTDQNNRQVDWTYLVHMEEDADGLIWVGHTSGLFIIDPTSVFDSQPRAIRPFVTNSSDVRGYLCEGYAVYDIGIDRNNCKWIASNDGLYYVSPDGTQIYDHFTTSNSDIPSNTIYSVECDVKHNRVYIYTDNGFAEYIESGSAASLDYNNVSVFPNPVEPDFTGMVKIDNLMENTYVTISDHNGNVVAQEGPVVGHLLWDGCGEDGERLPTGLYNIYAAQGALPTATGTPQATVMIIK